jgi:hypothetical protein
MSDFDQSFADRLNEEQEFSHREKNWTHLSKRLDAYAVGNTGTHLFKHVYWKAAAVFFMAVTAAMFWKMNSIQHEMSALRQEIQASQVVKTTPASQELNTPPTAPVLESNSATSGISTTAHQPETNLPPAAIKSLPLPEKHKSATNQHSPIEHNLTPSTSANQFSPNQPANSPAQKNKPAVENAGSPKQEAPLSGNPDKSQSVAADVKQAQPASNTPKDAENPAVNADSAKQTPDADNQSVAAGAKQAQPASDTPKDAEKPAVNTDSGKQTPDAGDQLAAVDKQKQTTPTQTPETDQQKQITPAHTPETDPKTAESTPPPVKQDVPTVDQKTTPPQADVPAPPTAAKPAPAAENPAPPPVIKPVPDNYRIRAGVYVFAGGPTPGQRGISTIKGQGISVGYSPFRNFNVYASADFSTFKINTDHFSKEFAFPEPKVDIGGGGPHKDFDLRELQASLKQSNISLGVQYSIPVRFWVRPAIRFAHTWSHTDADYVSARFEEHHQFPPFPPHSESTLEHPDARNAGNIWRLGVGLEHESSRWVFGLWTDYAKNLNQSKSGFDHLFLQAGAAYKF